MTHSSESEAERTEKRQDSDGAARSDQESAADRFRNEVASKQAGLDDFEAEEKLWSGGYSPKAMIGTWILMGVISIVLLVLPFVVPQFPFLVALGLIVVMWIAGGIRYASRRLGVHYEMTSQRFIHQIGILTRKTDRIEVIDIDDVSFSQGPIERVFGVGSIQLTSSDRTHPILAMKGIDEVRDVAGLIDDVRRKERRSRSLHIEAI